MVGLLIYGSRVDGTFGESGVVNSGKLWMDTLLYNTFCDVRIPLHELLLKIEKKMRTIEFDVRKKFKCDYEATQITNNKVRQCPRRLARNAVAMQPSNAKKLIEIFTSR